MGFAALNPSYTSSPRPAQLRRQPVHRPRHLAPLREPASWKTERKIGAVDAALAQAGAGSCSIARAAGDDRRRTGNEQILAAVGRAVAEGAHGEAVVALRGGFLQITRINGAGADLGRQRVMMRRQ